MTYALSHKIIEYAIEQAKDLVIYSDAYYYFPLAQYAQRIGKNLRFKNIINYQGSDQDQNIVVVINHLDHKPPPSAVFVGDPNTVRIATDFGAIEDVNYIFPLPGRICNELRKLQATLPYKHKLVESDIDGIITETRTLVDQIDINQETLICVSNAQGISEFLRQRNIPHHVLRSKIGVPISVFKLFDVIQSILYESRMINSKELKYAIRMLHHEITQRFGGKQKLIKLFSSTELYTPQTLKRHGLFSYILDLYRKEPSIIVSNSIRHIYKYWRHVLLPKLDRRWLTTKVRVCHYVDLTLDEYDVVITQKTNPVHTWEAVTKARKKIVWLK